MVVSEVERRAMSQMTELCDVLESHLAAIKTVLTKWDEVRGWMMRTTALNPDSKLLRQFLQVLTLPTPHAEATQAEHLVKTVCSATRRIMKP